jgi:hypothetical protein
VKLGIDTLTQTYQDSDGGYRALVATGLIGAAPSPSDIGHIMAAVKPSFYKASDQTIYRVAGTTTLDTEAMLKSLSYALADQVDHWSTSMETLTDSQRVGFASAIEGVAFVAVSAQNATSPGFASQAAIEAGSRLDAAGVPGATIPAFLTGPISAAMTGEVRDATVTAQPLKSLVVPASDASAFDISRLAATAPLVAPSPSASSVAAPPATAVIGSALPVAPATTIEQSINPIVTTPQPAVAPSAAAAASTPAATVGRATTRQLGMQFWYETMLPALGANDARAAALLWYGDSSVVSTVNGQDCLEANIVTGSGADQAALHTALAKVAAARNAPSTASSTTRDGNVVELSMCSASAPAAAASTPAAPPATTDVQGINNLASSAVTEYGIISQLVDLGLPANNRSSLICALNVVRAGGVPNWTADSTDAAVVNALKNVITFCQNAA